MRKILASLILTALSLYCVDYLMESLHFASVSSIITAAVVLSVLNTFLLPVLKFLSFPIRLLTFGLFSFIINGVILMLTIGLTDGAYVSSFLSAIIASVAVTMVNSILESIMGTDDNKKKKKK